MQFKMFSFRTFLIHFLIVLFCDLFECVENNNIISPSSSPEDQPTKICYEKFGCYSIEYPWRSPTRPVSHFPQPPEKVNPKYCLYTRLNPLTCDELFIDEPRILYKSNFVANGQVYFVAHGFIENGNKPWIKELTSELLKRSNANVIVIDWSGGSDPPYTQAVANIRLVGVMTAHLIKMMSDQALGLRVDKIHVIGHSLGAHLASYIGTTLRRSYGLRLGRITGLDPADPHFSKTDALVRLDPTDAIFVDNIHTDTSSFVTGGLGIKEPVGHVDFYPNGGQNQPGCDEGIMTKFAPKDGSLFQGVRKMLGCNHVRSYMYFIETVNSPNKFMSIECRSWEHYLNGTCFKCNYNPIFRNGTQCARFGFHSITSFVDRSTISKMKKTRNDFMLPESPKRRFVSMYLITGGSSPYYRSQFRVTWKISESSHEIGKFRLQIIGQNGGTDFLQLATNVKYYDPGSEHKIVVAGKSVGRLEGAVLEWAYETSPFNPLTWRIGTSSISISYMQIDSLETGESLTFCLPDKTPLVDGNPKRLVQCVVKMRY